MVFAKNLKSAGFLAVVIAVYFGVLTVSSRRNSSGIDEAAHVAAGVAYWKTGAFHLYRVNPPLVDLISSASVVASEPRTDFHHVVDEAGARSEWNVGWDFAWENRGRYLDYLFMERLPIALWSIAGAWVVYLWGRDLYGKAGGCLCLLAWCGNPSVIAWSSAVTSDIPSATAAVASSYAFWRYLRKPSWPGAATAGLLLGLALLTKYTLVLFFGLWPLLALIHRPWRQAGVKVRTLVLQAGAIVMISLVVINSGYGFHGSARRLGDLTFVSGSLSGVTGQLGNKFRGTWAGRLILPVPADYVLGIDALRLDFEEGLESYLGGEWRNESGWWYYYFYAIAVKEPIGTLLLAAWALASTVLRVPKSARWQDELSWLLPALALFGFVSSQTGYSHHMRYVLPAYPFMAVGMGKLVHYLSWSRWRRGVVVVALMAWSLASVAMVFPHTMSYFNEAAGGPENGQKHLANSNIDWGQDLLGLKEWLDQHPEAEPLGLAYYNYFDPRVIGINYRLPAPAWPEDKPIDPKQAEAFGPHPGWYAVSLNFLIGSRFLAPDGRGRMQSISTRNCFTYFNEFEPVARAGYSISIYHITPEQANAARRKLGLPPLGSKLKSIL